MKLFACLSLAFVAVVHSATLSKRSAPGPSYRVGETVDAQPAVEDQTVTVEDKVALGARGPEKPLKHTGTGQGKIVNGADVAVEEFPWVVRLEMISIQEDGSNIMYTCVGNLVSPNSVLTAAHCFSNSDGTARTYDTMWAYVGMHNVDLAKNSQTVYSREIVCVHRHEHWDGVNFVNDVAMLKLASDVPVTPVNIVNKFDPYVDINPNTKYTIAGWGGTMQQAPEDDIVEQDAAEILQSAQTSLISISSCQAIYGTTAVTTNNVCGNTNGGVNAVDTCVGDSGGPLFTIDPSGVPTLVAITSWGAGCAATGFPGVYTNVAKYRDWVITAFEIMDMCTETLDLQSNEDFPGKTRGGCTCKYHWGINDTTCNDGDATYYHCGMNPPCDGDNLGLSSMSWCFFDEGISDDACAPAGKNWDYCEIGLGLCQINEYATGGNCNPCAQGTHNSAGDDPHLKHTFTNQYISTQCLPNMCAENEYVVDYECVQCASGTFYSGGATDVMYSNGANPNESPCQPKTCTANEHVVNHGCASCEPGMINPAGDLTTGETTACAVHVCSTNEHVDNHECVACVGAGTNNAGDLATGSNTQCEFEGGSDQYANCFPNTPAAAAWEVLDDFEYIGRYRMINAKLNRMEDWEYVAGEDATYVAKTIDACATECRSRHNDCKAFEYNTGNNRGACSIFGMSVAYAGTPTIEHSSYVLYEKTTWCGAYSTTTPEPEIIPACPATNTSRMSSRFLQKRLKNTGKYTIGERFDADLEACSTACLAQQSETDEPDKVCKSVEWKEPSMNKKGTQLMPAKCELKYASTDDVPIKPNLEGWFSFKVEMPKCIP